MIEKSIRIYADTSVFGGVFDEEFSRASTSLLDQVRSGKFQLVISPVVEEEILGAPANIISLYRSFVPIAEMIPISESILHLQESYLSAGILAPQWASDAFHVAYATVSRCRIIVSWNFKHIVHFEKIALYNAINIKEGFAAIGIHSPLEVIEYEEEL